MSGLPNSIRTNDATQIITGLNSYAQNQFVSSLLPDEIDASTLNVSTASSAASPAIEFDTGTGLYTTGGTPGVYFSVTSSQVAQIDAGSIIQGATTDKAEISASHTKRDGAEFATKGELLNNRDRGKRDGYTNAHCRRRGRRGHRFYKCNNQHMA
jgi:hypothetical protein